MSNDEYQFRSVRLLPSLLTVQQAGWFIGVTPEDVSRWIGAGLLPACGDPENNAVKKVCLVVLENLRNDSKDLGKLMNAKYKVWKVKNAKKKKS